MINRSNPFEKMLEINDGKIITLSEYKRISEAHKYISYGADSEMIDVTSNKNYFRY